MGKGEQTEQAGQVGQWKQVMKHEEEKYTVLDVILDVIDDVSNAFEWYGEVFKLMFVLMLMTAVIAVIAIALNLLSYT